MLQELQKEDSRFYTVFATDNPVEAREFVDDLKRVSHRYMFPMSTRKRSNGYLININFHTINVLVKRNDPKIPWLTAGLHADYLIYSGHNKLNSEDGLKTLRSLARKGVVEITHGYRGKRPKFFKYKKTK